MAPYIERQISITELLSEEGLVIIEANADILLEEIGLEFRDDAEAISLWQDAGADITDERVRFPKGMLREIIKSAPLDEALLAFMAERKAAFPDSKF